MEYSVLQQVSDFYGMVFFCLHGNNGLQFKSEPQAKCSGIYIEDDVVFNRQLPATTQTWLFKP